MAGSPTDRSTRSASTDGDPRSAATRANGRTSRRGSPIVETTAGRVEGRWSRGLAVFRGVPYAAPPVGAARWAAPTSPKPWTGVREARRHAPAAAQNPAMMRLLSALAGTGPAGTGEDCLTVNVWTPGPGDAKRPVMVWIHGGAFMMGSGGAEVYDGHELAARGDVVVVTVNYRLGALGFLQLVDVAPDGRFASNPGLRDQVAALEWVRDNIAAFGGDPDRVTVFGESAGGMSVGALLGTPAANGLFHAAIAQSGAAHNISSRDSAERVAETFLRELGIERSEVDRLFDVPDDALLKAQRKTAIRLGLTHRGLPFQPAEDGGWLPRQPLEAIEAGEGARVPLLIGTNRDEWDLFQAGDRKARQMSEDDLRRRFARAMPEADIDEADAVYRNAMPRRSPRARWAAFQTDRVFRAPAERLSALHARHAPVYGYCFTWSPRHLRRWMGAGHAMEVPLVFGTWRHPVLRAMLLGARPYSKRMQESWIRFAREGAPREDWPTYSEAEPRLRTLGPRDEAGVSRFDEVRDFWAARDHGTRG